jgi:hypothetical protein
LDIFSPLLLLSISNPPLLRRKKPTVKEPSSKRAKPSPAAIPLTPDAPTPSSIRIDIDMEDAGGQFNPMPEANPMTETAANDIIQSEKASGSFQGQVADAPSGAVYFGDKSNLRSSILFPARKMLATSCPAASQLLLREQQL